ncbi:peptidyl-prolyl cis-trans isomerase FKBP3 [Patagioenas fasciata monilis]|uniref:peptidylprolyl isomerase n=1 Tax=Patagioenas fasciata monilis TaxID=372326 RepID=A0A1V4L0D2_PATFA|nr:peptidyl-prolyl cis-trans isomerase FKBP3 [Patagioenas fasciata monilis]
MEPAASQNPGAGSAAAAANSSSSSATSSFSFSGAFRAGSRQAWGSVLCRPPLIASQAVAPRGPPKYTKSILKKGDKTNFPKKGDTVHCWYTGKLQDGTVFDTNVQTSAKKKKAAKPFSFKVGVGKVIRGWDEALLTMSKGEKAQLEIEPEWAYGKKGQPDAKIPPNAKLFFEVELVDIE